MIRKSQLFYLRSSLKLVLLFILGCSSPEDKGIKAFAVTKETESEFKLSEIAKSVEYISLETNDSSYLSLIQEVKFYKDRLYVVDFPGRILVFDKSGKFIQQIGSEGEGPGEFYNLSSFVIDKDSETLYLASGRRLITYTLDNEYIAEKSFPFFIDYIEIIDKNLNLIAANDGVKAGDKFVNQRSIYKVNSELAIVDSIPLLRVEMNEAIGAIYPYKNYISNIEGENYIYTPVLYNESVIRDTLFRIEERVLNLGFDINIAGSSIGQPGSYLGTEAFGHTGGNKSRAVPGLEKYHGQDIFLTEALTLEANAAITQAKEEGKPFFLNMAHYAVHAPFYSDPRFAEKYKDSDKPEKAQAYATLIEGIDKSLGDIMQHVKELGLGENTLILFLGDNGSDAPLPIENDYSSSTPLKGKKGNHWEGGMRVPFIAAWVSPENNSPRQQKLPIAQNAIQEQVGTIIDLFPTILTLADIPNPEGHLLDGFPLQPQFNAEQNTSRDEVFLNHFPHGNHRSNYFTSLVKSEWKVVYHYPVEGEAAYELFNLKADPFEMENLAESNPDQLKLMMETLVNEMNEKQALYPKKNGQVLDQVIPK